MVFLTLIALLTCLPGSSVLHNVIHVSIVHTHGGRREEGKGGAKKETYKRGKAKTYKEKRAWWEDQGGSGAWWGGGSGRRWRRRKSEEEGEIRQDVVGRSGYWEGRECGGGGLDSVQRQRRTSKKKRTRN